MQTIFPLNPKVISQVAAGEVIERPASVVKELIENSLDAGATEIFLELQDAGKKLIVVSDNGQGIDREDFPWLIARHATSKLHSTDQLFSIHTFGFRGEALASIAAISELTIQSKCQGNAGGWQTLWNTGDLLEAGPIGMDQGTRIEVKNIFANVPARRKFLRQSATELRHIISVVSTQALMHPDVKWQVSNNNQGVLYFSPTSQSERIGSIVGEDIATQMLPLSEELSHIKVEGWIGRPPLGTGRPLHQYLFVNRRPVNSDFVKHTIKKMYQHYLDPRSYPVFCLFLTLPTEMVDIHLHPRKETVRFLNEQQVFEILNQSVHATLQAGNDDLIVTRHQQLIADAHTQTHAGKVLKKLVMGKQLEQGARTEPIVQIHNLYLAVATEEGLLLIDQHAAHERILYEEYREAFEQQQRQTTAYVLPKPLLWKASTLEHSLLEEHREKLEQLHFQFSLEDNNHVTIVAVPEFLRDRDSVELLRGMLGDLAELPQARIIDIPSQLMLSYLACRSAIKGGEYLTPERRAELLTQLAAYPTNYTCPHGRPVQTLLDGKELAKLFHRL